MYIQILKLYVKLPGSFAGKKMKTGKIILWIWSTSTIQDRCQKEKLFFLSGQNPPSLYNFSKLPSDLIDTQVRFLCHVHTASKIKRAGGFSLNFSIPWDIIFFFLQHLMMLPKRQEREWDTKAISIQSSLCKITWKRLRSCVKWLLKQKGDYFKMCANVWQHLGLCFEELI